VSQARSFGRPLGMGNRTRYARKTVDVALDLLEVHLPEVVSNSTHAKILVQIRPRD
jgi:hypothetical protein